MTVLRCVGSGEIILVDCGGDRSMFGLVVGVNLCGGVRVCW